MKPAQRSIRAIPLVLLLLLLGTAGCQGPPASELNFMDATAGVRSGLGTLTQEPRAGGKSDPGSVTLSLEKVPERGEPAQPQARMVIYSGALVLSNADATEAVRKAIVAGKKLGGYAERTTNTEVVLRIPVVRFDEAVEVVSTLGELIEKVIEGNDVTEQYFDFAVRLKSLKAAHNRYIELMQKATTVEQMTLIQQQIDRIEAEINRIEGRLRFLKSQSAMSRLRVRFVAPRARPKPPVDTGLPIPWLRELGQE